MIQRNIVITLALSACLGLTLIAYCAHSFGDAPSAFPRQQRADASRHGPLTSVDSARRARWATAPNEKAGLPQIIVEERVTGHPVPGAEIRSDRGTLPRVIAFDSPVISRTNEHGQAQLNGRLRAQAVIVYARGYVAQRVDLAGDGPTTVRLERGHDAHIRVRSMDGKPVSGAKVCLYPERSVLGRLSDYQDPGFANPSCPTPTHFTKTDGDGLAVARDVPAGIFKVKCAGQSLCTSVDHYQIEVPGPPLDVVTNELFGIIVAAASHSPIRHCNFAVDVGSLARSTCALAKRSEIEKELSERFPGSAAFVTLPRSSQHFPVEVTAVLDDGALAKGSWVLGPVTRLDQPVYLEVVRGAGLGELEVHLRTRTREVANIPLTASRLAGGAADRYRILSGESTPIPPGDYKLYAEANLPWMDDVLRDQVATVRAGASASIEVELPWSLTEVVVAPEVSDGIYDVSIHVGFSHQANGSSGMSPNWLPELGPVTFWFPPGRVEVFASASNFKPARTSIDITGEEVEPIKVPLELHER